jgi:hypothetical protein
MHRLLVIRITSHSGSSSSTPSSTFVGCKGRSVWWWHLPPTWLSGKVDSRLQIAAWLTFAGLVIKWKISKLTILKAQSHVSITEQTNTVGLLCWLGWIHLRYIDRGFRSPHSPQNANRGDDRFATIFVQIIIEGNIYKHIFTFSMSFLLYFFWNWHGFYLNYKMHVCCKTSLIRFVQH